MMVLTPYDYARKKVVYCKIDESIRDVAKRLVQENIGSMIVNDKNGKHVGMLTDAVLFNTLSTCIDVCNMKVSDLKLEPLVTAKMDSDIADVMEKFEKTHASRMALLDDENSIVAVLKKKNLDRFARFEAGEKLYGQHQFVKK